MDIKEENMSLRKLLWLNHGCGFGALYGDDGEMQCHRCMLDFKRDSIEKIGRTFERSRIRQYQTIEDTKGMWKHDAWKD